MVGRPPLLQRRLLCSNREQWPIKQVTKSNFTESLHHIKTHISESDFVSVSLQKTGSYSAPWHRVLPHDTAETGYLKAKYAAERSQVLQLAVCPFSLSSSKVIAHPYNFHLFPRDELKIGMPSYSFYCQSSYLSSMAREGFDFNICIYEGISYLSRAQEVAAKVRIGNPVASTYPVQSSSAHSVADTVFVGRIKSRVKNWIGSCKDSNTRTDDALIASLRKLILGSEEYGSRPCLTIDVCSERQVQLALKVLTDFSDDVVPLLSSVKRGGTQAVRVVLTSSKEDQDLFKEELQNKEEEQNKRFRGFREVIDLISASQKPVVAHNSLNDFTFIHSKFIAPLPPTVDEFRISLHSVFPRIVDISHLMKEISPLKQVTNLHAAISYIKRRFFAPMDMEIQIPHKDEGKRHGHDVLKITQLFAKLCSILKITAESLQVEKSNQSPSLIDYTNILSNTCQEDLIEDEDEVSVWTDKTRKVSTENLVFLWGFKGGMSAGKLKIFLCDSLKLLSEEFDVRLVDKSCAIVAFWKPDLSEKIMEAMNCGGCESVREVISEGINASGYGTYKRVSRLGLWEAHLADAMDKALADSRSSLETDSSESGEIYWDSDLMIDLNEL